MSILGMGLYKALKKVGVPEWMRVLGSLFLIFLYGVMIHAGVATLRAIMMLGINLCSKLLGRTYDMKVATAVAATLLIAGNPAYLTSAGFVLSFMAILALLLFYPFMQKNFGLSEQRCEKVWLRKLWDAFLVTFSITFFLLPVQTYYYYEIYPYSMLLNLFVLPLFTVVLYLGFAGGLVGMFFSLVGKFLLFPCKVIFVFYQWLCERTELLVANRVIIGKPSIIQVVIFYVCVLGVVYWGTVLRKHKKEIRWNGYRIWAVVVCFAACVVLCWRVRWNTQVLYIHPGDRLSAGDEEALYLQCLFPYGDEGFLDTNEQSMVLYGTVGDFSMLFTGDIGTETEAVFLNCLMKSSSENLIQDIDVLKVAHHGSSGSTSETFLQAVRPKVAIISCGVNNQYGHPHEETIQRLEEGGSLILTTSDCGAITIKIRRVKMSVECYLDRK